MKRILWSLTLTLIVCMSAGAQTVPSNTASKSDAGQRQEEAAAVASQLFAAMRAKNGEAIRALFMPDGQLVAIDKPRTGSGPSKTRVFTAEAFAKMIAEAKAPEFIEKMDRPEVRLFGDMALVFGRYTFHVGEKFSHCGTNSFQLARTADGWKIANAASTLEFDCGQQ